MIHQALLRRVVVGREAALVDFVETVAPLLLLRFVSVPALGGSGRVQGLLDPCLPEGIQSTAPEAFRRFSQMHDQSMLTHTLNGIFAAMRLMEKLPASKALDDLEQRLWLMGYVCHDYTKVYGVKVQANNLALIRKLVICLGDSLNFTGFCPTWREYLDDIVFLAQNTQTVEGANLNLRDFSACKTSPRRLEILRLLSSIADILVHVTSPSDVILRGSDDRDRATNLRTKMMQLFGAESAPRFVYHRLTEVRGLLSNLLNNATAEFLQSQGAEPFLYFPNGVVYLSNSDVLPVTIDHSQLSDAVWIRLVELVSDSEAFIRPWTTGFQVASALYELIGFEGVLNVGRRRSMSLRSNNATARLYGFLTGKSENDLKKSYRGDQKKVQAEQEKVVHASNLPSDSRVYRLSEFLVLVFREVKEGYKRSPDISKVMLDALSIGHLVSVEEAKQQKGGTYFGWCYAAAKFIETKSTCDENDLDDAMRQVAEVVLAFLADNGMVARSSDRLKNALEEYVRQNIQYNAGSGESLALFQPNDFSNELSVYTQAKSKSRAICSMCSSRFSATGQELTEVPFANQQYSNKHPLAKNLLVRGACPICRIEMILRRVEQPELSDDDKPIQIYLYPTYFFTPETARVVRLFLADLDNLDLSPFSPSSFIRHLQQTGFSLEQVMQYDNFLVTPGAEPTTFRRMLMQMPRYSERDASGMFLYSLKPRKPPAKGPSQTEKVTDTDAWVLPTIYGLALPLVLNVKAVITSSFVPVFSSGADFKETTVLDAPHGFTQYILGRDRFRVDEIEDGLIRLLQLYHLHLSVFAEPKNMHWAQLNAVAKDVMTDPYYVFAYYDRKHRSESKTEEDGEGKKQNTKGKKKGASTAVSKGIPAWDIENFVNIYLALGGDKTMGFIGELVDAYAQFYRADFSKLDSTYAVLRPLMTAIDATQDSDPTTEEDDLLLLIAGAVNDDQVRVRSDSAEGFDPIVTNTGNGTYPERLALSRLKIEEFAHLFVEKAFYGYCHGDRALLRERANRIRSAARFYYLQHYSRN
jgi:CRISPR-associated protein Csc3